LPSNTQSVGRGVGSSWPGAGGPWHESPLLACLTVSKVSSRKKRTGRVVQVAERLSSNCEALSSTAVPPPKNPNKPKRQQTSKVCR
jgi:hypothetical protein